MKEEQHICRPSDINPEAEKHWHLDRRVPVSIIGVLLIQIVLFAYAFGRLENRVTTVEDMQAKIIYEHTEFVKADIALTERFTKADNSMVERLIRLEIILENIRDELKNMNTKP